ncbi:AsmA-like C-terminal region-containing protein [Geminicoccus harenae]|uniref:AsmA-like C-terminal region-containing protein n=1 Tax=Geminicoccus harenae TaxID=2498453 RepID=UPI001C93E1B1|nr:AsmA-like C-terminal region-containing protein [Geminicoccus harenae]
MRLRAVLLILAAAAALLGALAGGFYFLSDPERIRQQAEASLAAVLDRPVRLEGRIGLSFLPAPRAVITEPSLVAEGATLARADRIDLALSPLRLLTGQPPVQALTAVRPELAAPVAVQDLLHLADSGETGTIEVADGRLAILVAPGTPPLELAALALDRREDADGIVRLTLAAETADGPLALDGTLRRADSSGAVPAELELRLGTSRIAWQGLLAVGRLFGRLEVEAAGRLPAWLGQWAALGPDAPWRGESRVDHGTAGLKLTDLAASSGSTTLAGTFELRHAEQAGELRLDLRDATLAAPDLDRLAAGTSLFGGNRIEVKLTGHGLDLRGVALPAVDVAGRVLPDGQIEIDRLAASVGADGALRLERARFAPSEELAGTMSLDLPTAMPVLGQLGVLPDWLPPDRPAGLLVEGELHWQPGSWALEQATLQADQSRFAGRIGLAADALTLAGEIDRLDLAQWLAEPSEPLDLLRHLPDGELDLRIGRLSRGDAWITDVALEARCQNGRLTVAEASAGDRAELHATLAGTLDLSGQTLDMVLGLSALRPQRIASVLDWDLPWLGRLPGLEGALSLQGPFDRLELALDLAGDGRSITASGTLGQGDQVAATALEVQARAPDLAALLAELALLPIEPRALGGAVATDARIGRSEDGRWQGRIELSAGPLRAHGQLGLRTGSEVPRLAGQLALAVAPGSLAGLYDFLSTALSFAPGSPLRWPGAWPAMDLRWHWLFGAELDLTLRQLADPEGQGLGRVRLAEGRLDLERLDLPLPQGGRLRGDLALDGRGLVPLMELDLALDDADSAALGGLLGIDRAPRARLAAEASLTGQGSSVRAIVADLAGELRLAIGPGTLPPAVGSDAPPFAFAGIHGALTARRGILESSPPHLAIDLPDRSRRYLTARLDLPVWFLDATLPPDGDLPGWHLLGPPGQVQALPLSPMGPASAQGEPAGRTPLPSGDPAPAPTP